MSERVAQVSVPEVVEQPVETLVRAKPSVWRRRLVVVGALRLCVPCRGLDGITRTTDAIEQHHRKPQPRQTASQRIRL